MSLLKYRGYPGPDLVVVRGGRGVPCPAPVVGAVVVRVGGRYPAPRSVVGSLDFHIFSLIFIG